MTSRNAFADALSDDIREAFRLAGEKLDGIRADVARFEAAVGRLESAAAQMEAAAVRMEQTGLERTRAAPEARAQAAAVEQASTDRAPWYQRLVGRG